MMRFDFVVAIEIIEHIHDTYKFLKAIINKFTKIDKNGVPLDNPGTEFFISTPNRNSPKIQDNGPANIYHCREWRAEEFKELLDIFFREIIFRNNKGDIIGFDTKDDIILAHCKGPKLNV